MDRITVLVVDDQASVRRSLVRLLELDPEFEVAGEAENGCDAVEAAERLRPHVVLMDVQMPEMDGIEATRRIVLAGIETTVVIHTSFAGEHVVREATSAGAWTVLKKGCGFPAIKAALEEAASR